MNFKEYPAEVTNRLIKISKNVISELVNRDRMSKKAFESYNKFRKRN